MRLSELKENEFNHFYATYLNMVKDEELLEALVKSSDWFVDYITALKKEKLSYAYGPNKWSIAEVLLHIIDTERIFQYRAFRFSRNDQTALPGFDHEAYVRESESEKRTKGDIIAEFLTVRAATLGIFRALPNEKLKRIGTASDMPWSVAALGFVISGHLKHHAKILEERYS
ncbi:DinB family protein [Maribacter antarcticus]|uniref:DinB family protein n=1 Tax=Maribacter antarcticus TaxID=505250 RepID=UPI00047D05C0|nr:DinB family protein [Maribacter antarcticus]